MEINKKLYDQLCCRESSYMPSYLLYRNDGSTIISDTVYDITHNQLLDHVEGELRNAKR